MTYVFCLPKHSFPSFPCSPRLIVAWGRFSWCSSSVWNTITIGLLVLHSDTEVFDASMMCSCDKIWVCSRNGWQPLPANALPMMTSPAQYWWLWQWLQKLTTNLMYRLSSVYFQCYQPSYSIYKGIFILFRFTGWYMGNKSEDSHCRHAFSCYFFLNVPDPHRRKK